MMTPELDMYLTFGILGLNVLVVFIGIYLYYNNEDDE